MSRSHALGCGYVVLCGRCSGVDSRRYFSMERKPMIAWHRRLFVVRRANLSESFPASESEDTEAGERPGRRPPEWRRRIAESLRKYYAENPRAQETRRVLREKKLGERNPMFGRHLPERVRRRLSAANAGPRNPRFGKSHSEETRRKISEGLKRYHAMKKDAEDRALKEKLLMQQRSLRKRIEGYTPASRHLRDPSTQETANDTDVSQRRVSSTHTRARARGLMGNRKAER